MSDALIEVSGVSKTFRTEVKEPGFAASIRSLYRKRIREVRALDGVDMTVREGEVVGLLGANGAGKTTLLKILAGIIRPSAGTVRVLGHEPWQRDDRMRRRIALIMGQKAQLWWDLPASDCFVLLKEIYRIPDAECASALKDLSERLSVGHLLDVPIRMLSLGERMKMELIAALLHRPKVLFLDEPTIGLDVSAQQSIRQFLLEYVAVNKPAVILTSHYFEDIKKLCDRVLAIRAGTLTDLGTVEALLHAHSPKRLIKARLDGSDGNVGPTDLTVFGFVERFTRDALWIEVDKDRVADCVHYIFRHLVVVDLSISEPEDSAIYESVLGHRNDQVARS
jgi:ABC-2 type transport system ATP-binding protein